MEKPQTLSVKDYIIRNMSTKMNVPERTIELVVNHQFESALTALNTCYTLEFAGWGKFYFNKTKARKKLNLLIEMKKIQEQQSTDVSLTPQKRHIAGLKLLTTINNIEQLKAKLPDEDTSK
jgi:nucleoid DNA-binding protein